MSNATGHSCKCPRRELDLTMASPGTGSLVAAYAVPRSLKTFHRSRFLAAYPCGQDTAARGPNWHANKSTHGCSAEPCGGLKFRQHAEPAAGPLPWLFSRFNTMSSSMQQSSSPKRARCSHGRKKTQMNTKAEPTIHPGHTPAVLMGLAFLERQRLHDFTTGDAKCVYVHKCLSPC